jgi:hypothetical protein
MGGKIFGIIQQQIVERPAPFNVEHASQIENSQFFKVLHSLSSYLISENDQMMEINSYSLFLDLSEAFPTHMVTITAMMVTTIA